MNLIKCPACGTEVSSQATSCPKCGQPFRNTTIQLTDKKWKLVKIVAWVMVVGGMYFLASGSQNGGFQNPATGGGLSLLSVGIIVLTIGKFGAWWTNK